MAPDSDNVALWFSSEHLKDVYPCLNRRARIEGIYIDRMLPAAPFPQNEEKLLFERKFRIPDYIDEDFPFWKAWRELPEEQKPDCILNLRIRHTWNRNVHYLSHAITIYPKPEKTVVQREETPRFFVINGQRRELSELREELLNELKKYEIRDWKGDIESIPYAYKEMIFNMSNFKKPPDESK